MDSVSTRVLCNAIATAEDELVRRLLLNLLMVELERLRGLTEAPLKLRILRGENT